MTPEGRVKDKIKKYLKAINAYYFMPVQMGFGAPGLDFYCCIKKRFVAIETKAEGKVPTPRQMHTMEEIKKAGGVAIWGDSPETIIEQIKTVFGGE